jgi:hypothetical protein
MSSLYSVPAVESGNIDSAFLPIRRSELVEQLELGGFSEEFVGQVSSTLDNLSQNEFDKEVNKTIAAVYFEIPIFLNVIPFLISFSGGTSELIVHNGSLEGLFVYSMSALCVLIGLGACHGFNKTRLESKEYNAFLDDLVYHLGNGIEFSEENLLARYDL